MPDTTSALIYNLAERQLMNSWLRCLAQIRQAPETWPTRRPKGNAA